MRAKQTKNSGRESVYERVTDHIMGMLKQGVVPWHQPWHVASSAKAPRNIVSKKAYRGYNTMVLGTSGYASPYWMTFKQAQSLGGRVRKGEKGTPVVFWKVFKNEPEAEGEDRAARRNAYAMIRYYYVFNLAQVDGVKDPDAGAPVVEGDATDDDDKEGALALAQQVADHMPNRPVISHGRDRASYVPSIDEVRMPDKETFESPQRYYLTLFHELAHSTGHSSRLGRPLSTEFGSEGYAREELVAEMTGAFLCGHTGIDTKVVDSSASYVATWLQRLADDHTLVVKAATQAQKAAEYIVAGGGADEEEED